MDTGFDESKIKRDTVGKFADKPHPEVDVDLSGQGDNPFTRRYATKEEKLTAIHAELETHIEALDTDENWLDYLDTMSRFHNYSMGNQILISAQCPEATRVAGFNKWKELDRHVRKGEKAISILAPCVITITKKDENGKPMKGDDGKPIRTKMIRGFTTASVFDVSQTEGKPLPESYFQIGDEEKPPPRFVDDLTSAIEKQGYTVIEEKSSGGAAGSTSQEEKLVRVNPGITEAMRARVLAHELGHIAAGHMERTSEYHGETRGVMEVEAEGISYVLLRTAGMHSSEKSSASYLKGWSGVTRDSDVVKKSGEKVAKTVKTLLDNNQWSHMEEVSA